MAVRSATPEDQAAWLGLRRLLWPESPEAEHRGEIDKYFAGDGPTEPQMVLLAFDEDGQAVGLAELSIRFYAEGCRTRNVAYLEGWYVGEAARRQGVGRALIEATEGWARDQGCAELASDADPDNTLSRSAHLGVGFEDVGLVRCFRKDVGGVV